MAVSVKSLLARPMAEIKRPPPLPLGTYLGVITKMRQGPAPYKDKETGEAIFVITYDVKPVSECEDVDTDLLKEALCGKSISERPPLNRAFPITEERYHNLADFLRRMGINEQGALEDKIGDVVNMDVQFTITHRADKDDASVIYEQIGKIGPIAED